MSLFLEETGFLSAIYSTNTSHFQRFFSQNRWSTFLSQTFPPNESHSASQKAGGTVSGRRQAERITLTSRGKPKAALISMEDYGRLLKSESRASDVQKWLAETWALSGKIEKRRGKP